MLGEDFVATFATTNRSAFVSQVCLRLVRGAELYVRHNGDCAWLRPDPEGLEELGH